MNTTPTLSQRAKIAWNVIRGVPPVDTLRSIQNNQRKEAPFLWPAWVNNQPQWHITDFNSYVREGFSMNTLIYSAIMYKVRSISIAPLRAYLGEVDKPEVLPDNHPLATLCKRPNPGMSGQAFMNLNTVYLNISGNSYVMLDRPKQGAMPTAMYPLRPDRVVIVPEGKTIKGYVYVPEGKSPRDGTPILPEDMMHTKLPNPMDPLEGMGYGLSPFAAMSQSADVDNAVTWYLNLFFKRGAAPNIYLKFNSELDDDVAARSRQRFMDMYGGYENWIGPAVMDNGGEISSFGQNFKEMGFEAIDDRNESRILGPFGVPGILIGTRLGVNRAINANAKELRQQFWQDTMLPELSWHETEYQYHLSQLGGEFVAFDVSNVPALSKDKIAMVTAFAALVNTGVPKDVAAAYLDIEFGEPLVDGTVAYMPVSLVPVGSQPLSPTPATPEATGAEPIPAESLPSKSLSRLPDDVRALLLEVING